MKQYERKLDIMKQIEKEGKISIDDVVEKFGISKVTARSDFNDLEQRGYIVRTRGGAVAPEKKELIRLISKTLHERENEKRLIADLAVLLIKTASTIIIDSGSTTSFLSHCIKEMNLAVITNSILVMEELSPKTNIELFVSGGVLRRPSMAMIGSGCIDFMKQFHADIAFIGATSVSVEHGISCTNLIEAETKRNMMKSALKVVLLADSTKIGKISIAHVCDWSKIDIFITDFIDFQNKEAIEDQGVEVIIPKFEKS